MNRLPNPHCAHLIEVARRVVRHLPDTAVWAAVPYGSVAWGDADEASDLDIMLLVERPAGYREVTRVCLADLFGHPPPNGPVFADLDRLSVESFIAAINQGGGDYRVAHSIILTDTDHLYERIRTQVSAEFFQPSARAARFLRQREQAEAQRAALRQAVGDDDMLAALHARLTLQEAGAALIEVNDDRFSRGHFVESVERALRRFNHAHLIAPFCTALALDAPPASVDRSVRAYKAFADALKGWVDDPAMGSRLPEEDRAWAEFTYGEHAYAEMYHKVGVLWAY